MRKMAIILFVFFIASSVLFGCSPRRTITLGTADNGKTIKINAGDTLKISLEGNPTTGYNWYASSANSQVLSQIGDPSFVASSNAMGAGGMITLTFKALSAGDTVLQLQYKRIWETGINPLYTYNLVVVVK